MTDGRTGRITLEENGDRIACLRSDLFVFQGENYTQRSVTLKPRSRIFSMKRVDVTAFSIGHTPGLLGNSDRVRDRAADQRSKADGWNGRNVNSHLS